VRATRAEEASMARCVRRFATACFLLLAPTLLAPAFAQKPGGILRVWLLDSPASMSVHEESTVVAERPVMGVFNNLVLFDQHVKQNSLATIVPELAESWNWNEEGTELTFKLRDAVKWLTASRSQRPMSNAPGNC
jgi:peptide/nickel transport system substrate-binding protein